MGLEKCEKRILKICLKLLWYKVYVALDNKTGPFLPEFNLYKKRVLHRSFKISNSLT